MQSCGGILIGATSLGPKLNVPEGCARKPRTYRSKDVVQRGAPFRH